MATRRRYETIDLTGDEPYVFSAPQTQSSLPSLSQPQSQSQSQTHRNGHGITGASQSDLDEITEFDEEGAADDVIFSASDSREGATISYQLYGVLDTKIVGVQYYRGLANSGEYVLLRREPTNQYDKNAIRVENVQREQIGHIPRTVASKLAPYMDSGDLMVEGSLSGRIGAYDCPLMVKLFGTSDPVERADLRARMKIDKLPSKIIDEKEREAKKRKAEELKRIAAAKRVKGPNGNNVQQNGNPMGFAGPPPSQGEVLPGQSMDDLMESARAFNPRNVGNVVENFGLDEEALARLPMADCPPELATELLPYQRQALQWLLEQERPQLPHSESDDAIQLWKRSKLDRNVFTNLATNNSMRKEPTLASGGILSDDMGLGKTLEMISLIVSDRGVENSPKSTLIVAPVGVMSNWSGQVAQHVRTEHALKVLIHHGQSKRQLTPEIIDEYDIVITSYTTLAVDYLPRQGKEPPPIPRSHGLFSRRWRRVILDEGHIIRNPQTKAALAASSLLAQSKWVLTGTPIINNLKDLYSLVRFIGLTGGLERLEVFNSILTRPVKLGDPDACLLLQALMASICLRRKKEMKFVNLRLPKISEYVHHVDFSPAEREKYDALQAEAKGILHKVAHPGGASSRGAKPRDNNYQHLLEVLLRLRQVCNHWSLCGERVKSLLLQIQAQELVDLTPENKKALQEMLQLNVETREDCPICLEALHNPVITRCAHSFGYECIERVIETQHRCPMCRAEPLDLETLVRPAISLGETASGSEDGDESKKRSSKIDAMLSILRASQQKNPSTKTVIFSQWTSFLTIIQSHLESQGYETIARIDGTLSPIRRDAALEAFVTNPKCNILLASLAVCSVGLNLVAANQVILADSWWAPAIEDQAVDRVYRLGQKREVTVWRLVVSGSVEERVLDVQGEKRELMGRAFREGEPGAAGQLDGKTSGKGRSGRGVGVRTRLADIERLLA